MKLKFAYLTVLAAIMAITQLFVFATSAQRTPRRIEVAARRFEYTPSEITLKKGEPVVLVLKSVDVDHGLRLKELGVDAKVNKGQTSDIPFTPTMAGTFVGHCSVFCGSGHGKMTLTLHIVE